MAIMKRKHKNSSAAGGDDTGSVATITAEVGDKFTYVESETVVQVMRVDDEAGTVDVQEPGGACRYWGGVPATAEWLTAAE